LSDETNSDHSSDPGFKPHRIVPNNLVLLTDRETRNKAKHHRRSKSLNNPNKSSVNQENLLNQSTRLIGSTEIVLDTTSNLLDECENIFDTTKPQLFQSQYSTNLSRTSIYRQTRTKTSIIGVIEV